MEWKYSSRCAACETVGLRAIIARRLTPPVTACRHHPCARPATQRSSQVNYLAHYLLAQLLRPALVQSKRGARVVALSSAAHFLAPPGGLYWGTRFRQSSGWASKVAPLERWNLYAQAKLAAVLFVSELQRRSDTSGVFLFTVTF